MVSFIPKLRYPQGKDPWYPPWDPREPGGGGHRACVNITEKRKILVAAGNVTPVVQPAIHRFTNSIVQAALRHKIRKKTLSTVEFNSAKSKNIKISSEMSVENSIGQVPRVAAITTDNNATDPIFHALEGHFKTTTSLNMNAM
jgi:hypothetical protein